MDMKKMVDKTKKEIIKVDTKHKMSKCDKNPKKQRLAIGGVAKERLGFPHTKK